jgi:hypothetical protein
MNEALEHDFPGLREAQYCVTSPMTPAYNCAAWAVGETNRCFDPHLIEGNYWPPNVARVLSIETLMQVYRTFGYMKCASSFLELGIEKIAVYTDARNVPTHLARQLASGNWTSKLGASQDIEHNRLEALEGEIYGHATVILQRPKI